MPRFDPFPGMQLQIGSVTYEVMPHPAVPQMAYGQEGRKATVYQLRAEDKFYALKVFKKPYQKASLVDTCQSLSQLSWIEGLTVCDRLCLTHELTPDLLQQYSDMEFAVLMPWITGYTWFDIVFGKVGLTLDVSLQLATNMSSALAELEANGLAHSDIACGNVIVDPETGQVNLIDVEDMYGAGFVMDGAFPNGTAGYQHRSLAQELDQAQYGQWCVEGDRFSGAILLAEILSWHRPEIRDHASEEHYFDQNELQDPDSPNYQRMRQVLYQYSPQILDCFEQAWHSTSLADCPPLQAWMARLDPSADVQHKGKLWDRTPAYVPEWAPVEEFLWHANAFKQTGEVEVQLLWQRVDLRHSYEILYINPEHVETIYPVSHRVHRFQLPEGKHVFRVRAIDSQDLKTPWSRDLDVHVYKHRWWFAKPQVVIDTGDQSLKDSQHEDRLASARLRVSPRHALDAPELLLAESASANIDYPVRWSSVRGANMYLLQMAENEPTDQQDPFRTVFRGPQTAFAICHDRPQTYYYRVCASWNNLYASDWSEVATLRITPMADNDGEANPFTEIATPTWVPVEQIGWNAERFRKTGTVEVNLLWRRTDFKHRYELSHTDALKTERIHLSNHNASSFWLSAGYHQFRVRAVDQNGCKGSWSGNLMVDIQKSRWWYLQPPQVSIVQEEL